VSYMQSAQVLRNKLAGIDGKDYGAFQSLKGEYAYPAFELLITQIPKDPYAPPHTGIYRVRVGHTYLGIQPQLSNPPTAAVAYRDFLARKFTAKAAQISERGRGTGYSGLITLDTPAQAILDRSAVVFTADGELFTRVSPSLIDIDQTAEICDMLELVRSTKRIFPVKE
jgi:hypothetical protein